MSATVAIHRRYPQAAALSERAAAHAHWLPRLAFAAVVLFHGLGKLADPAGFGAMLGLPTFIVLLVALAEVGGGLALIAGGALGRGWGDALTRIGAAANVPVLLGAIAMLHWPRWSFVATEQFPMGGMEFQVTLLAVALYFLARGNRP